MSFYRIEKILNNNVAVALNERRERVIVTGKSVGFCHRTGDVLSGGEIGRVYIARDELADRRLEALFSEIPFECVSTAEQIVDFATAACGRQFSQNLTISLADHISFATTQQRMGTWQPNLLAEEIERLYPSEYVVGLQALALVKKNMGVDLNTTEAASIAFHIINNSGPGNMSLDTAKIITGVEGMLAIIQDKLDCRLAIESSQYVRLVTHLKFLMRRIVTHETTGEQAGELLLNVNEEHVAGIRDCLDAVGAFLLETFGYRISNAERLYLFVHIVALAHDA